MQGYLPCLLEPLIQRKLSENPVVAMIGPRQCGKSTLAAQIVAGHSGTVHLDLERPSDLRKLSDPEAFFALHHQDPFTG